MVVQWLELQAFTAGGPGSILVGELRPYKLHGVAKKKTNPTKTKIPQFILYIDLVSFKFNLKFCNLAELVYLVLKGFWLFSFLVWIL